MFGRCEWGGVWEGRVGYVDRASAGGGGVGEVTLQACVQAMRGRD